MSSLTRVTLPNGALANDAMTVLGSGSLFTTGNVYYVNSVFGSDGNLGNDPKAPLATLQQAINSCTANKGDKIVVMVGHAETVTATSININKAGVTIINLGSGLESPTYTFGAAAATITVSAANCAFIGGVLAANFLNVAVAFTVAAAKDFSVTGTQFLDTSSILNFLVLFATDTTSNDADGLVIDSCKFLGKATSGAVILLSALGTNDRVTIKNNYYSTPTTGAGAVIPIATGKILTNFLLLNNRFNLKNATGTATGILITTNGSTNSGFIDGNVDYALPTTPLLVTASSGFVYGFNYHADAADASPYLLPAADS